jgi:hypothetical protein
MRDDIINLELLLIAEKESIDAYEHNRKVYTRCINIDTPLYSAFIWGNTPQGHKFWEEIDSEARELMDE